jgi:hypothetical protein
MLVMSAIFVRAAVAKRRQNSSGMNSDQQHRDENENTRCHRKKKYSGRQTLKGMN